MANRLFRCAHCGNFDLAAYAVSTEAGPMHAACAQGLWNGESVRWKRVAMFCLAEATMSDLSRFACVVVAFVLAHALPAALLFGLIWLVTRG